MDVKALHDQIHETIREIDEKLDSQTDQKTATRRKLTNDLISASENTWQSVGEQVKAKLDSLPVEQQIGIYFGLTRKLNSLFSEPLKEALDKLVESQPEAPVAEKLSQEEQDQLSSVRSDLYKKVKMLIETAQNFDQAEGMYMPSKRTGGRGPRGPRAINFVTWTIDGEPVENLKAVAEKYDQYSKTSELTAAMREANINLREPAATFDFTLPDGKTLNGVYTPPSDSAGDDDGIDDDDQTVYDED